jgi:hypothetical protein
VVSVQREQVDLKIGMMERAWSDCVQATTLPIAFALASPHTQSDETRAATKDKAARRRVEGLGTGWQLVLCWDEEKLETMETWHWHGVPDQTWACLEESSRQSTNALPEWQNLRRGEAEAKY